MKERYEAEIEQILKDLDTPPPGDGSDGGQEPEIPPDDLPSPFAPGASGSAGSAARRWVSPGKLAVMGIGVAVIGMVVARGFFWLPLAGLALIGVAVGWTFLRRFAAPSPPVWRGRAVERPAAASGSGSVWERVRRWWADL